MNDPEYDFFGVHLLLLASSVLWLYTALILSFRFIMKEILAVVAIYFTYNIW